MSSSVTEIHSKPQHYRVTLTDAIAHHKNGDLTAKGLLHFYVRIRLRHDWKIEKSQKEICEELGLSRTAFYAAKCKLEAEGVCFFQVPDSTKFTISLGPIDQSQIRDSQSQIRDSQSQIRDSQSQIRDGQSQIRDDKRPKPAPAKDSTTPSYSSSDSYQIFLKSLSEEERERFLKFQKNKAKKMPERPGSERGWFRANFEAHAEEWRESEGKSAPAALSTTDWENDPRREEWLAEVAAVGGSYIQFMRAGSTAEERDRREFFDWIQKTSLDWLHSIAS